MIKQYFLLICLVSSHYKLSASSPETNSSQERIIHGYNCSTSKYPFVVKLESKQKGIPIPIPAGSGTLIGPDCVLTSADVNKAMIMFGSKYIKSSADSGGSRKIDVIEDFIDPSGDIAILKLKESLHESDGVQFVTLPERNADFVTQGDSVEFMGFGFTKPAIDMTEMTKPRKNTLQCGLASIISIDQCTKMAEEMLKQMGEKKTALEISEDKHFCFLANPSKKQTSPGFADSGGPILFHDVQVGIIGHFNPMDPGLVVNFKVKHYLDFIEKSCGIAGISSGCALKLDYVKFYCAILIINFFVYIFKHKLL